MTTHARRHFHLSSLAVAGAFLLAGLSGTMQAAAAPQVDDGASGGSVSEETTSMMIEELGLVPTNGGPGSFSMQQPPVLVGSGTDREEVANTEAQETAGILDESARSTDLIALDGGSDTASSGQLDEAARSQDLIALDPSTSTASGTDSAAAQHGKPF